MIYLSDDTLKYACEQCVNNGNYKINIVVSDFITREYVIKTLDNIKKDYENKINYAQYCKHCYSFLFNNKSKINVFIAHEASKGSKCHLLIYDECAGKEKYNKIFKYTETVRY